MTTRGSSAPGAIAAGPPSGDDFALEIDDTQVAAFHEQGFLAIERITTDEEVAWLGEVWNELFSNRRIWFDLMTPFGANDDARVGQLLFPERFAPVLKDTLYYRNARRIGARLLGREDGALQSWGHMVLKPAEKGLATPWHQDEAYWEPEFDYLAVGAWLPLEDVDGSNGCMCFVPGSHRGEILPHRQVGGDARLHLLEVDGPVDTTGWVEVPLRRGGATFHHPRTLHATASNSTTRDRRAFATEFQTEPMRRAERAKRPWIDEQRRVWAAEQERTRAGSAQ